MGQRAGGLFSGNGKMREKKKRKFEKNAAAEFFISASRVFTFT